MALQKTEAIILKSQNQGETSKILTVYTKTSGKIKLIAKGARSSKSKFGGSLEPLNHIFMVFYEKENRDLQFLSQADILESFPHIRADLKRMALAMAAVELVNRLEVGNAHNPVLFKLLLETLKAINRVKLRPDNCLRAFLVRVLEVLGFKPNFQRCLYCKKPPTGNVGFDLARGGFICETCSQGRLSGFRLTSEVLSALRAFQVMAFSRLENYLTNSFAQQQADHFLLQYYRYHVEGFYDLNALQFLKKIDL